jgi:hypothetical protein
MAPAGWRSHIYVGAVMTDLSSRRGHITGTSSAGGDRTEITAEIPDAELLRYAIELRALTAVPASLAAATFTTNPCRRKRPSTLSRVQPARPVRTSTCPRTGLARIH